MDYYYNDRYVWELAYLSINEYNKCVTRRRNPLNIPNLPKHPGKEMMLKLPYEDVMYNVCCWFSLLMRSTI